MQNLTLDNVQQLVGGTLIDSTGDRVGKIEDIYLDRDTRQPEWALVNTGMFGSKQTFVPLATATTTGGDTLQVTFEKARIKDAPRVDADGELSESDERTLYDYYGLNYGDSQSDTTMAEGGQATAGTGTAGRTDTEGTAGRDTSGPTTDDAMTRSEERMRVQKVRRPSELVRLRKYITTQNVTESVPVQREDVRIEREPITDANVDRAMSGPELSEEEHEVTLTQETAVADTEVVPVERVRVDKTVTTDQEEVSAELREEHIEVERGEGKGKGETIA